VSCLGFVWTINLSGKSGKDGTRIPLFGQRGDEFFFKNGKKIASLGFNRA
jgi:hypothetical protein